MAQAIEFTGQTNGTVRSGTRPDTAAAHGSVDELATHVRRAVAGRPDAQVLVDTDSVTVLRLTPEGPDVTAILADGRCTLAIGSWYDDMYSLDLTLAYVQMAVEGNLRVRVDRLGNKPWQYALERRAADGTWHEESVVTLPRFRLWAGEKTTTYLHNDREIAN